eukprot:g5845.t1
MENRRLQRTLHHHLVVNPQVLNRKNRGQLRRLNERYLTRSERRRIRSSKRVEEAVESLRAFHTNVINRRRRNELANIGNMGQNVNEVTKINEEKDDNKDVHKITQKRLKYLKDQLSNDSELSVNRYLNGIKGGTKYDKEVIKSLSNLKNVSCVICFETLTKPTITRCKHIFCNKCILEWLKHRNQCPCCRKRISNDSMTKLSQNNSAAEHKILLKELKYVYKKTFPLGTPFIVACQKGRLDHVKLFVEEHDKGKSGVSVQEMVNELGKESVYGRKRKALEVAVVNEHVQIVLYLLKHGADVAGRGWWEPNYESVFWNGGNNLHMAASCSKHNLETLRILINRMTLDLINQEDADGFTPLDRAYFENSSPLKKDIIKLIRSHGGKSNINTRNTSN